MNQYKVNYSIQPEDYPNIEKPSIWFLFYKQNEQTEKSAWNRITQCWTGSPYIHSEFFFPCTNDSVSITSSEPVLFTKDKPYNVDTYDIWSIDITWHQFNVIYRRCRLETGKPFDRSARLYFGFSLFIPDDENPSDLPDSWICSKLMAFCCREAGIFPSSTLISDVHPAGLLILLLDLENKPEYNLKRIT